MNFAHLLPSSLARSTRNCCIRSDLL